MKEANRTYFLVLAGTRGSLESLRALLFVVVFFLGLDTFVGLNALIFWAGAHSYLPLFIVHLVVLGLCALLFVLSFFMRLLYRYQTFFSRVMAGLAALMVYSLCMMGVTITSFDAVRGDRLSPELFGVVGAASVVLVAGAAGVHVWLLRRRLRAGHTEKRTLGNFEAVSAASSSKTLWISVPLVAIVPNVITQGQFVTNTVGAILLVFLAVVTPSLPVEFTYLAYLKSQDRGYWQRLPRLSSKQREGLKKKKRLKTARKVGMWVLIVVAAVVAIRLLPH